MYKCILLYCIKYSHIYIINRVITSCIYLIGACISCRYTIYSFLFFIGHSWTCHIECSQGKEYDVMSGSSEVKPWEQQRASHYYGFPFEILPTCQDLKYVITGFIIRNVIMSGVPTLFPMSADGVKDFIHYIMFTVSVHLCVFLPVRRVCLWGPRQRVHSVFIDVHVTQSLLVHQWESFVVELLAPCAQHVGWTWRVISKLQILEVAWKCCAAVKFPANVWVRRALKKKKTKAKFQDKTCLLLFPCVFSVFQGRAFQRVTTWIEPVMYKGCCPRN